MASKKSGQRAAAAWDSPLVKRRNDLIQREVRYLADEGEDLPRVAKFDGAVLWEYRGPCHFVVHYQQKDIW